MTEIPDPKPPEPTAEPKKEETQKPEEKPIGLYPEQQQAFNPATYRCGGCSYRSKEKFGRCPSCGDVNEWD